MHLLITLALALILSNSQASGANENNQTVNRWDAWKKRISSLFQPQESPSTMYTSPKEKMRILIDTGDVWLADVIMAHQRTIKEWARTLGPDYRVDYANHLGRTLIGVASRGYASAVERFVTTETDEQLPNQIFVNQALRQAALHQHVDVVKVLLDLVDAWTPSVLCDALMMASTDAESTSVTRLLLSRVISDTSCLERALHVAVGANRVFLMQQYLPLVDDIDLHDEMIFASLQQFMTNNNLLMIRAMLAKAPSLNAKQLQDLTDYARRRHLYEIHNYLSSIKLKNKI